MAHRHQNLCPIPDAICAAYREQVRIIEMAKALAHSNDDRACCDFDEGLFWLISKIQDGDDDA